MESKASPMQRACALAQRLGFQAKLLLLIASMCLPMVLVLGYEIGQSLRERTQAGLHQSGLATVSVLLDLGRQLDERLEPALLAEATARIEALPAGPWHEGWAALGGRLAKAQQGAPEDLRRAAHTDLHQLIQQVAHGTGLGATGSPDDLVRLSLLAEQLPALQEQLSHVSERATPGQLPDMSSADRGLLRGQLLDMVRRQVAIEAGFDLLFRSEGQAQAAWQAAQPQLAACLRGLNHALLDEEGTLQDQDLATLTGRAQVGLKATSLGLRDAQQASLAGRQAALQGRLLLWIGLLAGGLLVIGLVVLVLRRSLSESYLLLRANMLAITSGDLRGHQPVPGQDELARLGRHVERLGQRISSTVAEIRTSASRVREAGKTVSDEALSLAARTERQGERLAGSVRNVSALGQEVRMTTEAVGELTQVCQRLRDQAGEGQEAMRVAVAGVAELQDSARRVGEINGVIDDIAFQTNLVALNASVEAARAGESGRGFSVVAAEIRQLALRCVDAAAEVRELIERTSAQVDGSAGRIVAVGRVLDGMRGGIDNAVRRVDDIGRAAERQSGGLAQIEDEVHSMQEITGDNARTVVATETASRAMMSQSGALKDSVSLFQLQQGTADEARLLAERARQRVSEVGWERAVDEFHRADGSFVDRDMYVFGFDADDRYIACGNAPARVGQRLQEVRGVSSQVAEQLLTEGRRAAAEGGGWIEYAFTSADLSQQSRKSAWIIDLGDGAFMGVGVYRQGAVDAG